VLLCVIVCYKHNTLRHVEFKQCLFPWPEGYSVTECILESSEKINFIVCGRNVTGEGVPAHIMKAYRGSRFITPLILNIGARWMRVVSFTAMSLYP
jgi:hypothetical protein